MAEDSKQKRPGIEAESVNEFKISITVGIVKYLEIIS
jgi:hypothetical protein